MFAPEQSFWLPTGVGDQAAPAACALRTIRPNPFNPMTTITMALPRSERVRLAVFDLRGRLVRVLVDEERAAGDHDVIWTGLDDRGHQVVSGVYVCRMAAGSFRESRRMTLVK